LARFIKYESCATVARTSVAASASRNATHSSSAQTRSAHRLAIFVKICITVAPIAFARGGASRVPPAVEMCAPSKSGTECSLVVRLLVLAAVSRLPGPLPLRVLFFGGRGQSGIVLFLATAQHLAAPRAVQRDLIVVFAQKVVATTARALAFERLMAADDAVTVLDFVRAKSRAHGAAFGDE